MHSTLSDATAADQLTTQGIAALKTGDMPHARALLLHAIEHEPHNETAWLWLSGALTAASERRYCLEQVLAINPAHAAAQRGLKHIPADVVAVSPVPARPVAAAEASPATPEAPAPTLDPVLSLLPSRFAAAPAPAPVEPHVLEPAREVLPQTPEPPAPAASPDASNQADVQFVIACFGKHLNHEQICRLLCEQRGYAWDDAELLVTHVENKHSGAIARRQLPLFVVLGVITFLTGCYLVGRSGLSIYVHLAHHTVFNPRLLLSGGTGVVMVLGSLLGIGQSLRAARR